MIIELLGAPGVGKTTLARMLSERLKDRQIPIELRLSYRPAKRLNQAGVTPEARRNGPSAIVRRIARPAIEMLKIESNTFGRSPDAAISEKLLHVLKPINVLWSVRLRQYIRRLSYAWLRAEQASSITLFDQGFAQAICSLAIVASDRSEWRIERALREAPSADLVIRLTAGDDVIAKRLRVRERSQSRMERILELDFDTNLKMARAVDTVYDELLRLGRPTISIETHDDIALAGALTVLESEIAKLYHKLQSNELAPYSLGDSLSATSL